EDLTNNLATNVFRLGSDLNINSWTRTGIGDLSAVLYWSHDFPQQKPLLKNVRTNVRVGPTFPTGKKTNPDQILSIPFGNDGAFGIVFGAGLDARMGRHLTVGVDVEFLQL